MTTCPSCGRVQKPALLCVECRGPLPAVNDALTLFAALGIARRLVIDLATLESAYHELGRRVHPDRFAARPLAVRDASLSATALLTRAYRTLRDPVSRGRYWLELNGDKLSDNNKSVPPDVAELVFEVQEELAEMREQLTHGGDLARQARHALAARREQLQALSDETHAELARNFAAWDADGALARKPELTAELKRILSRLAYLRTLVRDVEREGESRAVPEERRAAKEEPQAE